VLSQVAEAGGTSLLFVGRDLLWSDCGFLRRIESVEFRGHESDPFHEGDLPVCVGVHEGQNFFTSSVARKVGSAGMRSLSL
jgi:hypothetical protein